MKRDYFVAAFAVLALSLVACGQAPDQPPAAAAPIARVGALEISEARMRLPPQGRDVTAAYLTLTNTGLTPKTLVSASSPAARKLELHAHFEGQGGIKQMREVQNITIAAKTTILLVPGGLHIMVFGVKPETIATGQFPITLTFSDGATTSFNLPIVSNPVAGSQGTSGEDGHAGHKH